MVRAMFTARLRVRVTVSAIVRVRDRFKLG